MHICGALTVVVHFSFLALWRWRYTCHELTLCLYLPEFCMLSAQFWSKSLLQLTRFTNKQHLTVHRHRPEIEQQQKSSQTADKDKKAALHLFWFWSFFLCRTLSDSCFLSSPLCSELADVQWYGQDKAKPGTLVWDLPMGPRRVPLPSPTASPLSPTIIHQQPTTSSSKPCRNPALSRLDGLDVSLPPPNISPPLYYDLSIAVQQDRDYSLGSLRADFTGRTEKCHLSCWTVTLQHHRALSLLTYCSTQITGQREASDGKREHSKTSHMQLKTQQKQHRPFQDLFHIHLWSPDLFQCTASQSEDTCWIWATSLKPISRPKRTVLHFIPINTCLSFFFFISSSVFIKRKDDWNIQEFSLLPTTTDSFWIDQSHQSSWAGTKKKSEKCNQSDNISMVSERLSGY